MGKKGQRLRAKRRRRQEAREANMEKILISRAMVKASKTLNLTAGFKYGLEHSER